MAEQSVEKAHIIDHEPGRVRWPGSGAIMEVWLQSALDDPRPGDQFQEMYSYSCTVVDVQGDTVKWRDSVGKSGVMTRSEWALHFRYQPDEPKHWLHLDYRGDVSSPPGTST